MYWLKICEDMDRNTLDPKRGRQDRVVEQKQKAPVATNPFRMESLNFVSSEKILQYSLTLTDQSSFMGVDSYFDLIQLNKYIFVAMEESIYNLVPRDLQTVAKPTLYKSKYPPTLIPTGSTFCHATTSKPLAANLAGEFAPGLQAHTEHGQTKTFGHLKGDRKPSPDNFIKKHTGTMGNETLPAVKDFAYDCSHKKEPVPKVDDKPVQGLRSGKNFIVSNAIENILSAAKQKPQTIDYLTKKDFGKTPAYIEKIKENVTNQYKMIQQLHEQYDSQKQCLSEEEVRNIRNGLRRKWDEVNKEYQKNTHIRMVDTIGLKTRKEKYEKELAEIEADIKKLNKLYIFVEE